MTERTETNIDGTCLDRLFQTIKDRQASKSDQSYSARMLAGDPAKVAQKVGEEAVEVVIEAIQNNSPRLIYESADLLYHLCLLWAAKGVTPEQVWRELESRRPKTE
ncbi:MAG: phosphoribosyl-ATP diphosphatase [Candidatus Pacebacteria bacterium]|nr:phosphoribosyl-ATP diphosphatase [Candidatus Paceibacterota bacterium]